MRAEIVFNSTSPTLKRQKNTECGTESSSFRIAYHQPIIELNDNALPHHLRMVSDKNIVYTKKQTLGNNTSSCRLLPEVILPSSGILYFVDQLYLFSNTLFDHQSC